MRSLLPLVRSLAGDPLADGTTSLLFQASDRRRLGKLSPAVVRALVVSDNARLAAGLEPRFERSADGQAFTFSSWLASAEPAVRSTEMAALVADWRRDRMFGLHERPSVELQHVYAPDDNAGSPICFDLERSATVLFGFPAVASSVNGPSLPRRFH